MVRLWAGALAVVLGGCTTHTDRPLYAANPVYYDYYAPGYYGPPAYSYGPYYGPRSYSTFRFSTGRGHHHHGHRYRHRHHPYW
jgi:hypothetical protein